MTTRRLAIVGEGPKAMAIASKAVTLEKLGFCVPEIVVIEKNTTASHWDGKHGFTNGRQTLGTSPEKDVGFPYFSHCWGEEFNAHVNAEMLGYSWQSFLVEKNRYSDWVDRGKPAPEHRRWAEYLKWVKGKTDKRVTSIRGEVSRLSYTPDGWNIGVGDRSVEADGLVVTGPGRLRLFNDLPDDPRIVTLESFWKKLDCVNSIPQNSHIAVVGAGETAASIVLYLGNLRTDLTIDLIVPSAMSYSRGESYVENHVYTDPFQANWISWSREDRMNFIQRTDRGVFSLSSKRDLDQWEFVEIIPGWFRSVKVDSGNQLIVDIEYNGEHEARVYDYVAISLGFDPWGQVISWMDESTLKKMKELSGGQALTQNWAESQIIEDISLGGLTPKLHMPMLAAMEQGPGFGNLSCLGRLSDQILQSYVNLDE